MILDHGGDDALLNASRHASEENDASNARYSGNEEEEVHFRRHQETLKRSQPAGTPTRKEQIRRRPPRRPPPASTPPSDGRKKGSFCSLHQRQRLSRNRGSITSTAAASLGRRHPPRTDVMVAGKVVMVAGFGDVGKARAAPPRGLGCRVLVPRSIRSARCRRRWKATRS